MRTVSLLKPPETELNRFAEVSGKAASNHFPSLFSKCRHLYS